ISLNDQHVARVEPTIQFPKPIGSCLHLDAEIAAHKRQHDIPAETTADRTGQRHAHRRKAASLQRIDNAALGASALAARAAPAHAASWCWKHPSAGLLCLRQVSTAPP